MLVCKAAQNTATFVPEYMEAKQDPNGRGLAHIKWMLQEIENWNVQGDKAHRWLGYAQAYLIFYNFATLEQMKDAVKNA